jgi:hypothetical protein
MGKPILSLVLEVAAAGIMLYTSINPDVNLMAAFWLAVWKGARTVAQAAGRLGMRAEVRYFETVKL